MDGEPILKKTLMTMAAMVGACVVFVGSLSTVAVLITSHAVNPAGDSTTDKSELSRPGSDSSSPGSKPASPRSGAKSAQQI